MGQDTSTKIRAAPGASYDDALRKLGEMLRAAPKNEGGRPTKTPPDSAGVSRATLADIGIDKKTSARAQQLANLPLDKFERVKSGEMTLGAALR